MDPRHDDCNKKKITLSKTQMSYYMSLISKEAKKSYLRLIQKQQQLLFEEQIILQKQYTNELIQKQISFEPEPTELDKQFPISSIPLPKPQQPDAKLKKEIPLSQQIDNQYNKLAILYRKDFIDRNQLYEQLIILNGIEKADRNLKKIDSLAMEKIDEILKYKPLPSKLNLPKFLEKTKRLSRMVIDEKLKLEPLPPQQEQKSDHYLHQHTIPPTQQQIAINLNLYQLELKGRDEIVKVAKSFGLTSIKSKNKSELFKSIKTIVENFKQKESFQIPTPSLSNSSSKLNSQPTFSTSEPPNLKSQSISTSDSISDSISPNLKPQSLTSSPPSSPPLSSSSSSLSSSSSSSLSSSSSSSSLSSLSSSSLSSLSSSPNLKPQLTSSSTSWSPLISPNLQAQSLTLVSSQLQPSPSTSPTLIPTLLLSTTEPMGTLSLQNDYYYDQYCYDTTDNSEKLFWKIFRNSKLFSEIFKNFNNGNINDYGFGKQYFRYNEMNHIKWMLDNGHIEMLIDKIKKPNEFILVGGEYQYNQQTHFKNYFEKKTRVKMEIEKHFRWVSPIFKDIIKVINGTNQYCTTEFFQTLFTNYKRNIMSLEILGEYIIIEKNLHALHSICLSPFSYYNGRETLRLLIENSFLKGIKLLINRFKTEPTTLVYHTIILEKYTCKSIRKTFKIILYFVEQKLLTCNLQDVELRSSIYSRVVELIRMHQDFELTKRFNNEFYWVHIKLKDLLIMTRLVLLFEPNYSPDENDYSIVNNIQSLNQLISTHFTKQDLKLTLKKLLRGCPHFEKYQSIRELIIQYLKIVSGVERSIISNCFNYSLLDSFINYSSNEDDDDDAEANEEIEIKKFVKLVDIIQPPNFIKKMKSYNLLEESLKFGYYHYWKEFAVFKTPKNIFKNFNWKNSRLLFKYCRDDKKRQINFINKICECIDDSILYTNNKGAFKMYSHILLYLVIGTDDLELVRLVVKNLRNYVDFSLRPPQKSTPFESFYIQKYIRSTKMLDYCYQNFKIHFHLWLAAGEYYYFHRFKTLELFQRYEYLFSLFTDIKPLVQFKTLTIDDFNNTQKNYDGLVQSKIRLINLITYILSKPDIYKINSEILNCWTHESMEIDCDEDTFESILLPGIKSIIEFSFKETIINSRKLIQYNPSDIKIFKKNYQKIRLLDWIVDFRKSIDLTIIKNENKQELNSCLKRCTFDFQFKESPLQIGANNDTISLEKLIQNILFKQQMKIEIDDLFMDVDFENNYNNEREVDSDITDDEYYEENNNIFNNEKNNKKEKKNIEYFNSEIQKIVIEAARYGHINIFKHLYFNHYKILLEKPETGTGLISYGNLRKAMLIAIRHGHLHIMDFLMSIFDISFHNKDTRNYYYKYYKRLENPQKHRLTFLKKLKKEFDNQNKNNNNNNNNNNSYNNNCNNNNNNNSNLIVKTEKLT
ncbi:hypothetical protein ACTFIW_001638 [Dictyostelium discoideum]